MKSIWVGGGVDTAVHPNSFTPVKVTSNQWKGGSKGSTAGLGALEKG